MKKTLSILNLLSVLLVIAVNYISQALRLNGTTIGELSNKYDNLFTPASYAFAIWGLIFLSLLGYAIYQVFSAFGKHSDNNYIAQTGYWFVIANVLNCAWVIAFVYEFIGLSLLIMLGILGSLIKIIINTDLGLKKEPLAKLFFNLWPVSLYTGWISVATIANASTYLTSLGWEGGILSEVQWTVVMVIVAALVYMFVIMKRNLRVFGMVGIWAFVAIYIRHAQDYRVIAYTAITCAAIILLTIAWNGFRNRKNNTIYTKVNR